ncbi:hypothetical protein PR003_g3587 [Phytophthora rubi]|uniref:Uncharacterized protein n=1 Tax=Phytophthora rubi TaxID=129364 RepID=A0A6A3NI97_9STRA|nr:hypothetical protein PR002_g3573 [Phytophthora rubi]KAE9353985.1 hypothetical protein PR003_g3587 [Phytophthora rubi]
MKKIDGCDGNNNNHKKKKDTKKMPTPPGLVSDGEGAARLLQRMETKKPGVCDILVLSLPVKYRKLVQ